MSKNKAKCTICKRFVLKRNVVKCPKCKTRDICVDCRGVLFGDLCVVCHARATAAGTVDAACNKPVIGLFMYVDKDGNPTESANHE